MYKQIIAFTLLTVAAVSYANVSGWRDCGSTGIIRAVRAGDCVQTPCPFRRGETYTIELDGTATEVATSLPFNITATILGLPWTILEGNACETIQCPTAVGDPIYFSYEYDVSDIFPPVPTTVRVSVWNQVHALAICFDLDIQIV